MGGNCGNYPQPSTTNLCFTSVGEGAFGPEGMPNFCTLAGVGGDSYRREFCAAMSNAGEWGNPIQVNTLGCNYNDCNAYQAVPSGCCDACCGIVGAGLDCQRLTFTGEPIPCCFNDLACQATGGISNPPACYSDPQQQRACADGQNGQPNYRDITSTDCQDVISQYCTGTLPTDNPTSVTWLDRWTNGPNGRGPCYNALIRNIFRSTPCINPNGIPFVQGICGLPAPFSYDAEGYFWGERLVSAAMARYAQQGFNIGTLPGFPGYNPFQDFLYNNVCCPYPGLCQSGLDTVCAVHTAQRLSLNPTLAQWCGCHLPGGEYEDYSVKFNIPPECTPMCNRVGTIPIVGIDATAIGCNQNVCLIDGVTVNLVNAQIGGGINFNQICNNCVNSVCSCVVSDTTVDVENSIIGGNVVPIAQGCGVLTCSQTNPGLTGPNTITVACGTGFNPYAQFDAEVQAAQQQAQKQSWLYTMIAVGIGLVLIFLFIFFIQPNFGAAG